MATCAAVREEPPAHVMVNLAEHRRHLRSIVGAGLPLVTQLRPGEFSDRDCRAGQCHRVVHDPAALDQTGLAASMNCCFHRPTNSSLVLVLPRRLGNGHFTGQHAEYDAQLLVDGNNGDDLTRDMMAQLTQRFLALWLTTILSI
jgi:hypothetical protein